MCNGAIFDLDGVVLDSMSIWNDLGARYLRRLGVAPGPGLNEILFSMSMEQGAAYLQTRYALQTVTGKKAPALSFSVLWSRHWANEISLQKILAT